MLIPRSRAAALAIAVMAALAASAAADDQPGVRCGAVTLAELQDTPDECLPRITQAGVAVTIVTLREGAEDFPNPSSADDADDQCLTAEQGQLRHADVCHCEMRVQQVRLEGPPAGLARINQAEADRAGNLQCSVDMASVYRLIEAVDAGPRLVSILAQEVPYCQGCNGSCHGNFRLSTYDALTGDELVLPDVVEATAMAQLPDLLAADFVSRYGARAGDAPQSEALKKRMREGLAAMEVAKTGLYVDKGKVWVNTDDFIFSCA